MPVGRAVFTRRQFAAFLASALLAFVSGFAAQPARAAFAHGAGATIQTGFLPVGHWIVSPISSAVVPIFPLADSVTGATARIHQAYWDGTNDIPYDVAMGNEFGAYPYVCTLVQGPPGMTVEQSTYTTFQNPNYCRVLWHPQGNISSAWNGEIEVAVTDQQLNTIDMSWALWTVGQYSSSTFSGAYSVNGSSTITVTGSCTGTLTPGTVLTGTDIATGTYVAFDLTGSGCGGTYALSTAATGTTSGTVTGASGQGAVFVSTTGSGSTCTYSAPCTFSTAFGATYSATSFPGAIAYAFGGSYTGATNLPLYTDGGVSGTLQPNSARKPNALIGIPGQTVTLDASANQYLIYVGGSAADWYVENITSNGFLNNTTLCDKLIQLGTSARQTYDQVNWTNSGYGCETGGVPDSSNMSMFTSSGASISNQYLFVTDSTESNRQTGSGGNNIGFVDLYSYQYALFQRDTENSPSANLSAVFFFKIDEQNSELRENSSTASSAFGFDMFGSQYNGVGNNQVDYNLILNESHFDIGQNAVFTWIGNTAYLRNTILSGSSAGMSIPQTTFNLNGPGGPGAIVMTGTTGGSLTLTGSYTCGVTSVGNSGESKTVIGSFGKSSSGVVAGDSNQNSLTLTGSQDAIDISWTAEPGALSYNAYCEVAGSGTWTEYTNVTSPFLYTGAAGTLASPPASSTALSTGRYYIYSNAFATTNATAPPPAGATVVAPSYPTSLFNIVDGGGVSGLICLNTTTTGCNGSGQQVGDLNTTYSGAYGTLATLIGTVGYKIQ